MDKKSDSEIIDLALKRFKFTAESEYENRVKFKSDIEFYTSNQWDNGVQNDRLTDKRPCLTINRLPQFTRQITNSLRQNMPSLKVIPSTDGDEDVAEIFNGIIRHIQESSQASVAYSTANNMQVVAGLGYFRVITDYCRPDSFEQDIKIKRIKNPLNVYFDPAAIEPDYSDAMYAFITEDVDKDEFKKLYPKAEASYSDILINTGDEQKGWATEKAVRIAEYFAVEEIPDGKIYLLADGTTTKELPEGVEAVNERSVTKRKVMWYKMTGCEILESREWPGKYIPIIPVIGEDIDVDGERIIKGMVRDAKDSQRMYNYFSSAQAEMIALAPKAPFIAAEGQVEGYKEIWSQANTKNFAYLPYKPMSIGGTVVGAPQRQTAEPPVQAMVQAVMQAGEDMKATTGIYDASLGAKSNETSGKAINARTMQGDVANYHYLDNFAQSILHLGRILIDLIPKIYDSPRIVRLLGKDGTSEYKKINQESDDKDEQGIKKVYDVTVGEYDVVVEVGPSYKTKRQEDAANMTQVLQGNPELWSVAGDLFIKAMDWPDADQMSERLRKMLPQQLQESDGEQVIPPQVKQQLDQSGQMIEELTKTVHELKDQIDLKKEELESKERIAYEQMKTDITIAAMKMKGEAAHTVMKAELQSIATKENMAAMEESAPESEEESVEAPVKQQEVDSPQGDMIP